MGKEAGLLHQPALMGIVLYRTSTVSCRDNVDRQLRRIVLYCASPVASRDQRQSNQLTLTFRRIC